MHFDKLYFITIGIGVDNRDGQYFCLYVDQDCAENTSHKKNMINIFMNLMNFGSLRTIS